MCIRSENCARCRGERTGANDSLVLSRSRKRESDGGPAQQRSPDPVARQDSRQRILQDGGLRLPGFFPRVRRGRHGGRPAPAAAGHDAGAAQEPQPRRQRRGGLQEDGGDERERGS